MSLIRPHSKTFSDDTVVLRPLTDDDLPLLSKWNGDENVLHFSEGDVDPYTEEEVASTYAALSQKADCFMIEVDGVAIGECRIQPMRSPFPEPLASSTDCRRIDIMIGEADQWGKSYGSRAIGLLCRFAFERTSCSHLFAFGIFDYNERARKAFERNGFKVYETVPSDGDMPGEITMFKGSINKIF